MFGRRTAKKSPESSDETVVKPDGKGRPTPSRKEAEAARKKRVTPPRDRREAARLQRARAKADRVKMKAALDGKGDDRNLPARDRGPVRRFCRDFVDSRRNVAEFLLPALVVILVLPALSFIPTALNASVTLTLWILVIVLTVMDTFFVSWRVRKELAIRFPDTNTKGARLYSVMRSSQMRWLRLPKPRLKPGSALPSDYR
ncbi:MAG: DUF3043 domain-containing protein [Propionibacteriales bacterium]|nr:DUF3043 domain-containing protein [Propionibacteriales bacterium]